MAKPPPSSPRRSHWTEADARRVLAAWEQSGDSLETFARARGLIPQRLAWWRKRLRAPRPEATPTLTLVPATVIAEPATSSAAPIAVLRLPHGLQLEFDGASPGWIAALVRALAGTAP